MEDLMTDMTDTDNLNPENTEDTMTDMTDTDNTEDTPTLAECFVLLEEAEDRISTARAEYQDVLTMMAQLHGKSFTSPEGTLHQVRTRKGVPYLATLKESPKVYLARARAEATERKARELLKELNNGGLVASEPVSPIDAVVTEQPLEAKVEPALDNSENEATLDAEIVLQ